MNFFLQLIHYTKNKKGSISSESELQKFNIWHTYILITIENRDL